MTENKRFKVRSSRVVDDTFIIDDNERKYLFPIVEDKVIHMYCKALNDLDSENKELKDEVYDWKASAEDYLKLGKSLQKENEKLKFEIQNLRAVLENMHGIAKENGVITRLRLNIELEEHINNKWWEER